MAWFDGASSAISMFNQGIVADGDDKYTQTNSDGGQTDRSAWVNNRVVSAGVYINYVFKRTTEVPAPFSFAFFGLAFLD